MSAAAMRILLAYSWPGNVRELEHVVERACLVCDGSEIGRADLPVELLAGETAVDAAMEDHLKTAMGKFERSYLLRILERTHGNVQRAAEIAGIHRTTFYDKLGKHDIQVDRDG